jgi:DNA-binding HxlR family transcriptional regulator
MTAFSVNGKFYNNPVEFLLERIGGKWKMPILWRLHKRIWRYNELQKDIPHITHKMLTQQLKELEKDGFILRNVYRVVPPKVEYSLTEKGRTVLPLVELLREWGLKLYVLETGDTTKTL